MVSLDQMLGFTVVSIVIILIPGPAVLFVVGRALAHGRRVALASVLGSTSGTFVAAAAVACGVGAVVQQSAVAFTVLKYAGAAYLVYLGVKAIRERGWFERTVDIEQPPRRGLRTWVEGFVVGVTNPKAIVFFTAVLPQFVTPAAGSPVLQMLLLGALFAAIALVCDSTWGIMAAGARSWLGRSPRRLRLIGGVGGLSMIGLGVTMAATGRKD